MKNSEQGESYSQSRADDRPDVLARQALLPEQHFDRLASGITNAPERNLLLGDFVAMMVFHIDGSHELE